MSNKVFGIYLLNTRENCGGYVVRDARRSTVPKGKQVVSFTFGRRDSAGRKKCESPCIIELFLIDNSLPTFDIIYQ